MCGVCRCVCVWGAGGCHILIYKLLLFKLHTRSANQVVIISLLFFGTWGRQNHVNKYDMMKYLIRSRIYFTMLVCDLEFTTLNEFHGGRGGWGGTLGPPHNMVVTSIIFNAMTSMKYPPPPTLFLLFT